MKEKYNPHSIEKQARKWPVLLFCQNLLDDVSTRTAQLYEKARPGWVDPFCIKINIDDNLAAEYGIDASRLACLSSGSQPVTQNLLESACKWLSSFFTAFSSDTTDFSPGPWLEAALQIHDQILLRNNHHAGLALARKAFKTARPGRNISLKEKDLILSTISPFAPVLAGHLNGMPDQAMVSLKQLPEHFTRLICVRFALPRGGWHWKVFDRQSYENDPIGQLRTVKWVAMALGENPAKLQASAEGTRICLY